MHIVQTLPIKLSFAQTVANLLSASPLQLLLLILFNMTTKILPALLFFLALRTRRQRRCLWPTMCFQRSDNIVSTQVRSNDGHSEGCSSIGIMFITKCERRRIISSSFMSECVPITKCGLIKLAEFLTKPETHVEPPQP